MTLDSPPPKMRWPRAQRFSLSEKGLAAEASYRNDIVAARDVGGRASFEAARVAWAQSHGLAVDDGLYLAEVKAGPVTFAQIVSALETCGKNRLDAIAALERLADAGMIAA
ncbi:MAG: hypothetical protein IPJ65_12650 [Archangiaceae bacterium]|nr:hypothetical protein [Archangiaceae bacterium]